MKCQPGRIRGRVAEKIHARGFALIEVLVSLAVLAIGLLAVLTAVLSSLELQKDSEKRFRAGLLLQEKLAEITVVDYDGMPVQGVTPDGVFRWSIASQPWFGWPEMPEESEAKSVADSLISLLFEVGVEISWENSRGASSVSATQMIRAYPGAGVQE